MIERRSDSAFVVARPVGANVRCVSAGMGRAVPNVASFARRVRRAFSLAELMIALVILGLGLLFIAAALPVGLEYTRKTVDMAEADAAGEYAVRQLESTLRTSKNLIDLGIYQSTGNTVFRRRDNFSRPRYEFTQTPPVYPFLQTFEPFIKVRPFALGNIGLERVLSSDPDNQGAEIVDNTTLVTDLYVSGILGFTYASPYQHVETDFLYSGAFPLLSLLYNPVLPGVSRVYPPIAPVTSFDVESFFDQGDPNYVQYKLRSGSSGTLPAANQFRERKKAVERRIAWTALYRRISYSGSAGADGAWFTADDVAEDPLLYEIIVIVTQRPTVNHRFPQQNPYAAPSPYITPNAVAPQLTAEFIGTDRLAPTPWLVTFDPNEPLPPQLVVGTDYVRDQFDTYNEKRFLLNSFNPPPTLSFKCTLEVGALLPVGSVFIPAMNDQRDHPTVNGVNLYQTVGFVPSAPESLPIYKVIDRPDDYTVVVENNGLYPWLSPTAGALDARHFPVWVIPPAFVERDPTSGQPIFENKSPILKIIRRTIKVPEIP